MKKTHKKISRVFYAIITILFIASAVFFIYFENYKKSVDRAEIKREEKINKQISEIKSERQKAADLVLWAQKNYLENHTLLKNEDRLAVPQSGKAILANLTEMTVSLYDDGTLTKKFPIAAKGQSGSRYETPVGIYKIDSKEKNHFIDSRKIYMPYSMHFFGNYFIHGMPYYQSDGRPIHDGPSGGCIRMTTDNAKIIYDWVSLGTPVLVIEPEDDNTDDLLRLAEISLSTSTENILLATSIENSSSTISAQSYLVSGIDDGFIFVGSRTETEAPIYSLSKLMTSVIADEMFRDDKEIVIDSYIGDTLVISPNIKNGQTFAVSDLFYPMIFLHDDLVAFSMSTSIGSKYFAGLMNQKALATGLTSTHFADPAGRDENSISTAKDLALFIKYFYQKHPYISKITLRNKFTLDGDAGHDAYAWQNMSTTSLSSPLLFNKIILPQTEDGATSTASALAAFKIKIDGKKKAVAVVVLNSTDVDGDMEKLLRYVERKYK